MIYKNNIYKNVEYFNWIRRFTAEGEKDDWWVSEGGIL